MRRSYCSLPIYTGDVSGVCSALYELGSMVVMHDPSGCNSTYNTHDELRWYNQDSLIYISGLSERDAIFGNDKKFVDDVIKTAGELKPKFIALAPSPIPYLTGTDLPALAGIIEKETGIPVFAIPVNGMHDYVSGAGMAFEFLAQRVVIPAVKRQFITSGKEAISDGCNRKVNLLGVTPLDFGPLSTADKLRKNLEEYGWEVNAVWAMGQTLEDLMHSAKARANLVVSSTGLRAAELMWEQLHIPYVVGTPLGNFTRTVSKCLETVTGHIKYEVAADTDVSADHGRYADSGKFQAQDKPLDHDIPVTYLNDRLPSASEISIIGEPVTAGSMAALIEMELGSAVRVLCPLEEWKGLLAPADLAVRGEEELELALQGTKILVADPLYRPVCPKDCRLAELPHIAFSGRIYADRLPDLNSIIEEIKTFC